MIVAGVRYAFGLAGTYVPVTPVIGRIVVAVCGEPGTRRRGDDGFRRVVQFGEARPFAGHVPAPGSLDCRLAVSKHVVRGADPRVDVLPVGHVVHARERPLVDKRTGRNCRGLHPADEAVEPDAVVQGEIVQRPLISGLPDQALQEMSHWSLRDPLER